VVATQKYFVYLLFYVSLKNFSVAVKKLKSVFSVIPETVFENCVGGYRIMAEPREVLDRHYLHACASRENKYKTTPM
jgi:hypothetical protein